MAFRSVMQNMVMQAVTALQQDRKRKKQQPVRSAAETASGSAMRDTLATRDVPNSTVATGMRQLLDTKNRKRKALLGAS